MVQTYLSTSKFKRTLYTTNELKEGNKLNNDSALEKTPFEKLLSETNKLASSCTALNSSLKEKKLISNYPIRMM